MEGDGLPCGDGRARQTRMEHRLENERIRVTVNSAGAELTSAVWKSSGREMIWQADPAVWGRHAPLLFPYCGRLQGNLLRARGEVYPAGIHGFARDGEFELVEAGGCRLALRLRSSAETYRVFPYDFELIVRFALEGDTLRQTVEVYNPGQPGGGELPFAVGFHPGFSLAGAGEGGEWELVFDVEETPAEVLTPGGYVSGETRPRFTGKRVIELRDDLFADDSICLTGLQSRSVCLRRRGSEQGVRVGIEGFAQVLLWGPASGPLPFVCIEPWHGLPDETAAYDDFIQKRPLTLLGEGEKYATGLELQFFG